MSSGQRPGGVGQYFCDGVLVSEVDTKTCAHCQHIIEIPNRRKLTEVADFCRLCMAIICLDCAGKPCRPHLRAIEEAEEAYHRRRQFSKALGL